MTDALTLCASDVPVTFRLVNRTEPSDPVTLPCSVWLVGTPVQLPGEYEGRRRARTLFKFVMGEDPGPKLGRKPTTGDRVEWEDLTLSVLGTAVPTAVPTKADSWQRYAADDAWMLFAELLT